MDENNVEPRKLSKQEELIAALGLGTIETEEEKRIRIAKRELELQRQESEKQNKLLLALSSVTFALLQYIWQFTHPVSALQLLSEMQASSLSVTVVGHNNKPSVVDFWAPWCENCKASAPTLRVVEREYASRVNFILVNADDANSWPLIEAFGVDAIPHLALVSADGNVETALIGLVPASVLKSDLNTMLDNAAIANPTEQKSLPYTMYDAFRLRPEKRHISFEE